ncbi:MAG: DUF2125 domain-containing protein [Rhodospirillaceae bacterium]|nr:DUF2125 domain-containing protein [Rhodospirillaceae bacterium]MBT6118384.1 DUF2125 domain-containing protein [Rhodospirillaceae bacterium]
MTDSPSPRQRGTLGFQDFAAMRRLALALLVVILLACGGWTGYWFHGAGQLREGVLAWAEARRTAGDAVALGEVSVTGFPLRFDLALAAPTVGTRKDGEPLIWQGPPTTVTFRPWSFDRFTFEADGRHRIAHAEPDLPTPILIEAAGVSGAGRIAPDGRLAILGLDFDTVQLGTDARPDTVRMERAEALIRLPAAAGLADERARSEPGDAQDSAALRVEISGLDLPDEAEGPLGNKVDLITLLGGVRGAIPNDAPDVALAAWRDSGGTIEIYDLKLAWGPLHMSATGTATLDEEMRPLGALTAEIRGYTQTLDALVAVGTMERRTAEVAKFLLGMMAEWPDDTGKPILIMPLSAQDGIFSVGPISLFRLPPLRWSRPRSE